MIYILAFIYGSCIGSFLNVCIYRLPKDESLISPRSKCTQCGKTIFWYDNIPILSILILKFSCRYCKGSISVRYLLVEFLTGMLTVLLVYFYYSYTFPFSYLVVSGLCVYSFIVLSFIDLDYMIIPNEITYSGIILGPIFALIFPHHLGSHTMLGGFIQSLIGMFVGGGILYIIGAIAERILKKEAMGFGDVKLLAMIGALFGWKATLVTIFLGSLIGAIMGGFLMVIGRLERGSHIPFGPYLAIAGFVAIFWAQDLIIWYLSVLGAK